MLLVVPPPVTSSSLREHQSYVSYSYDAVRPTGAPSDTTIEWIMIPVAPQVGPATTTSPNN